MFHGILLIFDENGWDNKALLNCKEYGEAGMVCQEKIE
jgi:hypothetical protein